MLSRIKFEIEPLVDQVLDQLPDSVWASTTTTFADLALGGGQFVRAIEQRLRLYGHSDTNIHSRVWGFEESDLHIRYAVNKHKLVGHYVKMSYEQLLTLEDTMKFSVVVGNPPYQKPGTLQKDDNLWSEFLALGIKLVEEDTGYLGFVTPASWGSLGSNIKNPGSSIRKKIFAQYNIDYVDFSVAKHFTVGSTFTSYVINKRKTPGHLTNIVYGDGTAESVDFDKYVCFPLKYTDRVFVELFNDFRTHYLAGSCYPITQADPYKTIRASMPGKIAAGDYSKTKSVKHSARAYHTNSQDILWTRPEFTNTFHTQWKVVFSYSGSWKVEVTNDCSLTDASMCILVDTEDQARSVASVLSSRLIKFLITRVYLWSGYFSGVLLNHIPQLPMTQVYTDTEVEQLILTEQQRSIIIPYLIDNKKP
jgi:hypothetical protein